MSDSAISHAFTAIYLCAKGMARLASRSHCIKPGISSLDSAGKLGGQVKPLASFAPQNRAVKATRSRRRQQNCCGKNLDVCENIDFAVNKTK
jgi:hypothetical protein